MKIEHDFHIHTRLSPCAGENGGTYDAYIEQFKKEGLTCVGFADHYWDENVGYDAMGIESKCYPSVDNYYRTQNTEYVLQLKKEIEAKGEVGIGVFFGAEVEYDPVRRDIALSEGHAELFDFVIVPNSHTHMMMPKGLYEPYEKHLDFMVQAYEDIIHLCIIKDFSYMYRHLICECQSDCFMPLLGSSRTCILYLMNHLQKCLDRIDLP